MILTETLTALSQGMKRTFNDSYPVEEFRDLPVGIEYPADPAEYPGIWVDFDFTGSLSIAGIDHREYVEQFVDGETRFGEATRWFFEGRASFTVVSLSALSRNSLFDEVVKIIGFGNMESGGRGVFRDFIHENPLVSMTLNTDEIAVSGMDASPGTPWGTNDVVYEATLSVGLRGEFLSTPAGSLVPLSEIRLYPQAPGDPEPAGEPWHHP